MHGTYELAEVSMQLAAVATGRESAQTVIKNGSLVNVNTREIIPETDVAISHGRIALVGDAEHTIGENTKVIDAKGAYLTPGFMDGHIHVESSMMSVREYARLVVPRGTTSIFMDPHEITNVMGMEGVRLMIEDGKEVPLRTFVTMPSCVPASPGFEDAGARIDPEDIREAMKWEEVVGLGEMMNFPGVIYGDPDVHAELAATLEAGKTITGHYSMPETGSGLNAYIASGVRCCHESVRKEDALAKMRLGMNAQLREGSAWHDVKETVRSITEHNIDTRFATLISDDTHPNTLLREGHLDHIVKRAIEEGVNPITAVQMATINVAQCYDMSRDLGSISPGRAADILLIGDLSEVKVEKVFINGELVAEDGEMKIDIPPAEYPEKAMNTVKLAEPLRGEDFAVRSQNSQTKKARVRVMEVMEAKVGTNALELSLDVKDGSVRPDPAQDVVKTAVVERHTASGSIGRGFAKGFGLKRGAVASTVAHDSHNLLIVGTNDEDMAFAGNKLAEVGGGMIAVHEGEVLALNPLPIAGLMSYEPVQEVAKKVEELDKAWKELGSTIDSPFMTMALLALPVLPELRLTNRGLVDTVNFDFTDLIVSEEVGDEAGT